MVIVKKNKLDSDKNLGKKNAKLKDFLCLVKNKRNRQYSFVLKKKALYDFGLSPENILNMKLSKNKLKTIPIIKKK